MNQNNTTPPAARLIFGVFGLVFFGVGLTVIIFLWSASGFDAPPLIFRLVGSFIAVAFIAFGGTMAASAIRGNLLRPRLDLPSRAGDPVALPAAGYSCPHCGAALDKEADVSPLGDVKCPSCGAWFNIHKRA